MRQPKTRATTADRPGRAGAASLGSLAPKPKKKHNELAYLVGNENGKKKKTFPDVLSAPTKKQAGRTPVAPGADQRRPSSVHSRVQFFFKKKMKKFSFQEGKKKSLPFLMFQFSHSLSCCTDRVRPVQTAAG